MMLEMIWQELMITLQDPKEGARRIMARRLRLGTAWAALILVSVAAAVLGFLGFLGSGLASEPAMQTLFGSPLRNAVLQFGIQALTAVLLYHVGRAFGGTGGLPDAVALVAWSAVPLLVLELVQLIAMFVFPALADLAGFAAVFLSLWLITQFACALHGFTRPWVVLGAVLATSFLIGFIFILIIASLGVELPNV